MFVDVNAAVTSVATGHQQWQEMVANFCMLDHRCFHMLLFIYS
jgi:hypothetical protein